MWTRAWCKVLVAIGLASCVVVVAGSASAIQYFNVAWGFDNLTLQLSVDMEIPIDATFAPVHPDGFHVEVHPEGSEHLILNPTDLLIEDVGANIDRMVEWEIINPTPEDGPILLFLTQLDNLDDYPMPIDVDIDGFDQMLIASYGPYVFAGFYLEPADFTLVDDRFVATRRFGYTVQQPQVEFAPPRLGVAYVTTVIVPEPSAGLLLGTALSGLVFLGRRQR